MYKVIEYLVDKVDEDSMLIQTTDKTHLLNKTGIFIYDNIELCETISALADLYISLNGLSQSFKKEIEIDFTQFVNKMISEGLIQCQ